MTGWCKHPDCERPVACRGYCCAHYQRLRRGQDLNAPLSRPRVPMRPCDARGCNRHAVAGGLCDTHAARKRRGDPNWERLISRRADGVRRMNVAEIRVDLVERLDRIAHARGLHRGALLESILDRHFADEMAAERGYRRVA